MQKKLLGMAVTAALAAPGLAMAQSAVQVYGTVHMSFNATEYGSSTAGADKVRKFQVASHSSNWGLRSTETLGGGLTAWFQAEFNMKMERENDVNGGSGTARNSGVGLRGGFGNIYVGTWETPWAQTFRLWDVGTIGGWGPTTSIIGRREQTASAPSRNCGNVVIGGILTTPTTICVGADATTTAGYQLWRRYGSSVFYESPSFAGAQFKIAYQPNETKTGGGATLPGTTTPVTQENPSAWSASLTWAGMGGRARAFLATQRNKDWTQVGQTDNGWTAGGGYDAGVVNVGATYETFTYKGAAGDIKAKQYGLGLAVPVGAGKIGASYAVAKDLNGGGAASDTGAKMYNLGYELGLSKRTAVGFGIAKIDNKANSQFTWTGMAPTQDGVSSTNSLAGSDVTNLFVAIRHSF